MKPVATYAAVNRAIKPLGLKIVASRGYYYFVSLKNRYQIGSSIFIYRISMQPVETWVADAKYAIEEDSKLTHPNMQREE